MQNYLFFLTIRYLCTRKTTKKMKTFLYCAIASAMLLCSCHESIEKRAQREAREYTERNCPTPVLNYMRTDSVVFEMNTRTYHYYCSIMDELDVAKVLEMSRKLIVHNFMKQIDESTSLRAYKSEGFNFALTLHSGKDSKVKYFDKVYTPKEYNK